MALDATLPSDDNWVSEFAARLRETRALLNTVESNLTAHTAGNPVYTPIEVTTGSHNVAQDEIFIKANAGIQAQIFIVDPSDMLEGVPYILKKTDPSVNTVTLQVPQGFLINDSLTEVVITLQNEVLRYLNDGTGIVTC